MVRGAAGGVGHGHVLVARRCCHVLVEVMFGHAPDSEYPIMHLGTWTRIACLNVSLFPSFVVAVVVVMLLVPVYSEPGHDADQDSRPDRGHD